MQRDTGRAGEHGRRALGARVVLGRLHPQHEQLAVPGGDTARHRAHIVPVARREGCRLAVAHPEEALAVGRVLPLLEGVAGRDRALGQDDVDEGDGLVADAVRGGRAVVHGVEGQRPLAARTTGCHRGGGREIGRAVGRDPEPARGTALETVPRTGRGHQGQLRTGAPVGAATRVHTGLQQFGRVVGHGGEDVGADRGGQRAAQLDRGARGHRGGEDAGHGRLAAGFDGVVAVAVGAVGELPVEGQPAHLLPAQHDAAVGGEVAGVAQPERELDPGPDLGVRHVRHLADGQLGDADDHFRLRGGAGAVLGGDGVLQGAGGTEGGARVRPQGEVDVRRLGLVLVDTGDDLPGGRAPRVVRGDGRDARQVAGVDDQRLVRGHGNARAAVVELPAHVDRLRGRPHVELCVRLDHGVGLRRRGGGTGGQGGGSGREGEHHGGERRPEHRAEGSHARSIREVSRRLHTHESQVRLDIPPEAPSTCLDDDPRHGIPPDMGQ